MPLDSPMLVVAALVLVGACASGQEFFPRGSLGDTPSEHEYIATLYSKDLRALLEPSVWELSRRTPAVEVYRFLYLRTFHHPISVRLTTRSDGTAVLTSKETSGHGGTDNFIGWLDQLGFCKLPVAHRGCKRRPLPCGRPLVA